MNIFWGIVLFVLGLVMFFKPKSVWKVENLLFSKGDEPSKVYLLLCRWGGLAVAIVGAVSMILKFV